MTTAGPTLRTSTSVQEADGARPPRPPRRLKRSEKIAMALGVLVLLPIALVWIYPFVWVFSSSLQSNAEIFASLNPFTSTLQLDNYIRAWTEADMGRYFLNTIFVTGVSILLSVTVNALLGYVLGRYVFPGKRLIYVLLALVVFLPEGYTVIPIFDLIDNLGLSGSLWGIALAEAGGVSVIVVLLFTGYFAQLPKELEEAAKMDGAGFLRIFARIYLPLARPVLATAVILQFMHAWNDFLLPLVLTLSQPDLRTLAVGIYSLQNQYFSDWGMMSAASTIALLPIILVFIALQKYFIESFSGAVKG
ncbi:carbohydrate ABC transporter permease [Brachybacterium sacelli]|uniref:Raffinose/stachyose/melibiose transport system permease protein n=1 Tax=Brachybacterium sacelli TaxID=173364 RepID=A0ABS4WZM3_9MICO|nr:carbohydrate ABC transporter permease [Brachybacterium sacelli]MBP2381667.1 raffinose/stachyose/melibiose transport system permease protein [Brachybacterium sacelli]